MTQRLCWHCCHTIGELTVPLPIQYDDRKDTYKTMGQFCSFECAKGFNRDSGHYRWGERGMLLSRLKRRMLGMYSKTVPAPPRQLLDAFGGPMTIETFRGTSTRNEIVNLLPVNLVPHETLHHTTVIGAKKDLHTKRIDFKGILAKTTGQNEMLRLRRPQNAGATDEVKHGSLEQFVRKA